MSGATVSKRLPRGFRRGHSDALACPHRDVSCCEACAAKHAEIVDVYGQHFWIPDPCERLELKESMAKHERDEREYRADASGGYDDEPHFDGGRRSDAGGGL